MQFIDVSYRVGSETWLHAMDLTLAPGINVLLGATLAGKTTAMRLMAGLDRPTFGRVMIGDQDVTGVPVRNRRLAMVYQQFINYPTLTVFENIASPLRIARQPAGVITETVSTLAERLRLTPFLDRHPAELSGGQQQRIALARALAKDADLVLLDEPLVNLDYKLREDLRQELRQLFAGSSKTVVYATTEPGEALQLGGTTTVLMQGRLVQQGRTLAIFRRPATLEAARAFSDPPLNEIPARIDLVAGVALLPGDVRIALPPATIAALTDHAHELTLGLRAHTLRLRTEPGCCAITGRVDLAEISGSETYVHFSQAQLTLVAQLPGVHQFSLGEQCTMYIDAADLYFFAANGQLLFAPERYQGLLTHIP